MEPRLSLSLSKKIKYYIFYKVLTTTRVDDLYYYYYNLHLIQCAVHIDRKCNIYITISLKH